MHKIWTSIYFTKYSQKACREFAYKLFAVANRDADMILDFSSEFTFSEKFANLEYMYKAFNRASTDNILYNINIYFSGISNIDLILKENGEAPYIYHEYSIDQGLLSDMNHDRKISFENFASGKILPIVCDISADGQRYHNYKEGMFESSGTGGTFNLMHNGHRLLLSLAAMLTDKVLYVGVTDRVLLTKKSNPEAIESPETRILVVNDFLTKFKKDLEYRFITLKHPMESWDMDYKALIVSEETMKAIDVYNNLRQTANLDNLEHAILRLVESHQHDAKFSSSQLREIIVNSLANKDDFKMLKETFITAVHHLTKGQPNSVEQTFLGNHANYRTKDDIPVFDVKSGDRTLKAEYIFLQLCLRYRSSKRFYHTLEHILDCIQKLKRDFEAQLTSEDFHLAVLSIFYHDVVYDSKAKDNEEQSATYFNEAASVLDLSLSHKEIIASIIRHTEKHDIPEKSDKSNLFKAVMDVDLSILSDRIEKYIPYAINIRKEYSYIPWAVYQVERAKVLRYLSSKSPIFHCNCYKEEDVRRNVAYEIENLLNQSDL